MKCKCGGSFKRIDIRLNEKGLFEDIDKNYSNFKCDNCGKKYSQKKRKSRKYHELSNKFISGMASRSESKTVSNR